MNLQAYAPLEALLQENDFYLAYSLVSMLRDESQDATASALVSVFVQPNSATFQRIIGRIIDYEISRCGGHEPLVFRDSMSPAARFLDILLDRYASKFMLKALSNIRKRILKVADQLEVNPAKTDAATIAHNVSIVTQLAFDVLTNVLSSAKKFPLPIAHIIALLAERLTQYAPSDSAARTAVGTIVMLKLVGPLLCSSEGLLSTLSPRKMKGVDSLAVTKGLVTIAKILQAIANGITYEPENYMSCFNEFISNTEPVYIEFMQNLLKLTSKSTNKIVDDLPARKLLKEWSRLYSYLHNNQERVRDKCLALDDLSESKGGVESLSGATLAEQFTHACKLVALEKEKAELDNLQVFM